MKAERAEQHLSYFQSAFSFLLNLYSIYYSFSGYKYVIINQDDSLSTVTTVYKSTDASIVEFRNWGNFILINSLYFKVNLQFESI